MTEGNSSESGMSADEIRTTLTQLGQLNSDLLNLRKTVGLSNEQHDLLHKTQAQIKEYRRMLKKVKFPIVNGRFIENRPPVVTKIVDGGEPEIIQGKNVWDWKRK